MSAKVPSGTRVQIVPRPYEDADAIRANKYAVISSYSHVNGIDDVYSVKVDGEDCTTLLYRRDFVEVPKDSLEDKLSKLEAEVAAVKAEIRKAESDASMMPVGTIITAKTGTDVEAITKQSEGTWRGVYLRTSSGGVRTEELTNDRMTELVLNGNVNIYRP